MQYHIAILSPDWIELILDGSKTIGCWFTKKRCVPYGKVNRGDIVYMKETGGSVKGLVKGRFTVSAVETFDDITVDVWIDIYASCGHQIFGKSHFAKKGDAFYKPELLPDELKKWNEKKYATLIYIREPVPVAKPFPFEKPKGTGQGDAWVVCSLLSSQSLLQRAQPAFMLGE